jgi:hypothetical protein
MCVCVCVCVCVAVCLTVPTIHYYPQLLTLHFPPTHTRHRQPTNEKKKKKDIGSERSTGANGESERRRVAVAVGECGRDDCAKRSGTDGIRGSGRTGTPHDAGSLSPAVPPLREPHHPYVPLPHHHLPLRHRQRPDHHPRRRLRNRLPRWYAVVLVWWFGGLGVVFVVRLLWFNGVV